MEENIPIEQLSKKEKRELKHQQKSERRESAVKKQTAKKYVTWGVATLVAAVLIGGLVMAYKNSPQIPESDIISRNGVHWHPALTIYVKGEKQEIPANIGLMGGHQPTHTHSEDSSQGIIHLEFEGLVRKSDTTLGQFFKVWNKDIRSFGPTMKMTVNGVENTEYENYLMQDKDKIELSYE